jgi:hypothetical protein
MAGGNRGLEHGNGRPRRAQLTAAGPAFGRDDGWGVAGGAKKPEAYKDGDPGDAGHRRRPTIDEWLVRGRLTGVSHRGGRLVGHRGDDPPWRYVPATCRYPRNIGDDADDIWPDQVVSTLGRVRRVQVFHGSSVSCNAQSSSVPYM